MESIKKSPLAVIIAISLLTLTGVVQGRHGCGFTSPYSYDWSAHVNWFMAPSDGFQGILINMNTFSITKTGSSIATVKAYEGTSIVSDDNENVLFYTNGRNVYKGIDTNTVVTYSGLLQGNESGAAGNAGSATQGIIIVRHPMNTSQYHVFTTDDSASDTTLGINHFILDKNGALISGPSRLGHYRSGEGITATLHANGFDIWVATTDVAGHFNAYLITCDGLDLDNSKLNQPGGALLSGDTERGGMAFSWNRLKMAAAYPNSWPNMDKQIILFDFDNSTGLLSNPVNVGNYNTAIKPTDIIFSPNDKRIYISRLGSTLDYIDLSLGNDSSIANSLTSTGISTQNVAAIEIGPSGKLYVAGGHDSGLIEINENIDSSTTFSSTIVPGTQGYSSLGLPTMYLPSHEIPIIQFVQPVCYNATAVDLSTLWHCAGTDAELTSHTYTGTGITDSIKGIFDPSVTGEGLHMVTFANNNCTNNTDDLFITVKNDSTCIITSSQELNNHNNNVYPNPVNDYLNVGNNTNIQIFSTQGSLILESREVKVNVSTLKSGVYVLVFQDENGYYSSHKLVKN